MAWHTQLTRRTRLVAVGGLATGLGLGAMVAVNAATPSNGAAPSSAPAAPGHGDAAARKHRGHGDHHGFGTGGTITAINGTTLTLRTEAGSETVNTTDATKYFKERQAIKFADLHTDDIVRVMPAAGSPPPSSRGTGTITAGAIGVVLPSLGGRVTEISGDTVSLVGPEGRLFTVTLTGSTRYFHGKDAADRSAITKDSRIRATGNRDSLTHLTADVVTVLPARPDGAPGAGRHRGGAIAPGGAPMPPAGAPGGAGPNAAPPGPGL